MTSIILLFLCGSRQEGNFALFLVCMFTIKLLILDATFTLISSREVLFLSGNKGTKNKTILLNH